MEVAHREHERARQKHGHKAHGLRPRTDELYGKNAEVRESGRLVAPDLAVEGLATLDQENLHQVVAFVGIDLERSVLRLKSIS